MTNKTSNCSSCGAEVIWVELKSGKRHPLDAEIIVSDGTKLLYVDDLRGFKKLPAGRKGYVSHFATCPDAKDWRKK